MRPDAHPGTTKRRPETATGPRQDRSIRAACMDIRPGLAGLAWLQYDLHLN